MGREGEDPAARVLPAIEMCLFVGSRTWTIAVARAGRNQSNSAAKRVADRARREVSPRHSKRCSLSLPRVLGLEPRSRPQPTQKCWDCKACGHFSCRYHQVGGCARLLLAGGMLNITATYSRIISATGRLRRRGREGQEEEMMVVEVVAMVKEWGKGYTEGGRYGALRFGRSTVWFQVRSPATRFRGSAGRTFRIFDPARELKALSRRPEHTRGRRVCLAIFFLIRINFISFCI